MARGLRTGFDRHLDKRMKDSTFAAEYIQARVEIDAIDGLIRALDQAQERSGLSKADLACRIDAKPEIVRRLLAGVGGNPTMSAVLKAASTLGYHLELVPNSGRRVMHRSAAARARQGKAGKD